VLFFFLSILEDSGYMARVAFVMDKPLRKIGLSGRSFVPMLIGFGCSVPAIMSTRTLPSERDRKMTIMLTPFMSCSAKLPIYAIFTAAFFPDHAALVMILLYVMGIVMGIISGLLMKSTLFHGNPVPFVMELPNYRMPSGKTVVLLMWEKAKDFLQRAFTIIFVATIVIWFLQTFDSRFNVVSNSKDSMLAAIGQFLAPIFAPLGFGDWRASTALLTGFTAKEAVISTFAVLMGTSASGLASALGGIFSPLTAFSFLTFTLLYTPCIAAITAVKNEMHSVKSAFGVIFFQCGIAWIVAFFIYHVGLIFA
jgi:ferrous iron transport protein B